MKPKHPRKKYNSSKDPAWFSDLIVMVVMGIAGVVDRTVRKVVSLVRRRRGG